MALDTVIFDMDGLLIDSEPLWQEAGSEMLQGFGVTLTDAQYHSTTGLRTKEWLEHWFHYHQLPMSEIATGEKKIIELVTEKIKHHGHEMPGAGSIIRFFHERNFKIGLASSSPLSVINVVIDKLGIHDHLQSVTSAEFLSFGKPHPQVFLECAAELESDPRQVICFEDSYNGMIAAKAAKMKCVIIPASHQHQETRWDAADLKLKRLHDFTEEHLTFLSQ